MYRCLIESIVKENARQNTYLAGGGIFLKYRQDAEASLTDPKKFAKLKEASCLHVYIKCGQHEIRDDLKKLILSPYDKFTFNDSNLSAGVIARSVAQSIKTVDNVSIWFDIVFTTDDIFTAINRFTYRPCMIGHNYPTNNLYVSRWFLVGGESLVFFTFLIFIVFFNIDLF